MERKRRMSYSEILKSLNIEVHHDFFNTELLNKLTRQAVNQIQRKEKFTIGKDEKFPIPLDEAATLLTGIFTNKRLNLNTAILKRYILDESSEAFKIHRDPDEYKGYLCLCSLSGRAKLKVFSPDMKISTEILCLPNTVVFAPVSILHQVSEPDEKYGTRCFLFFGYSDEVV